VEKYRECITRIGFDPAGFALSYSVAFRVKANRWHIWWRARDPGRLNVSSCCAQGRVCRSRGDEKENPMSAEENKAIVRRYFEEAWGKGNLDVMDELMAPDFVNHGSVPGHPVTDREDMKRIEEATRQAFPDVSFEMHDMVAEGDMVVYRWTGGGSQQGEFMGIPPSGRRFSTQGAVFSRVRDGKIVEQRRIVDVYTMMQQLGAIPSPEH
jgi:steroid delta-isomerase-like uncharacterized protein